MSARKKPPRITQELLDYLEECTAYKNALLHANSLLHLGQLQGVLELIQHLEHLKAEQDKDEMTDVSIIS